MKVEGEEEILKTGFLDVRTLNKKKSSQAGMDDDARNLSEDFNSGTGEDIPFRK